MASAIMANAAELTAKENTIVDIGAWTARGEQDKLGAAFKAGFDAGLTLNEAKELVGQLYAYCGFPRALNAAGTLMKVWEGRAPARPMALRTRRSASLPLKPSDPPTTPSARSSCRKSIPSASSIPTWRISSDLPKGR